MTTIISTGGALGHHRCDARCHAAEPGTACDCICRGAYHAVGGSMEAQRRMTEDWLSGALTFPGPEQPELRLSDGVQGTLLAPAPRTTSRRLPRSPRRGPAAPAGSPRLIA